MRCCTLQLSQLYGIGKIFQPQLQRSCCTYTGGPGNMQLVAPSRVVAPLRCSSARLCTSRGGLPPGHTCRRHMVPLVRIRGSPARELVKNGNLKFTKILHKKLDLFKNLPGHKFVRARLLPRNNSRILIKEKGRLLVLFTNHFPTVRTIKCFGFE